LHRFRHRRFARAARPSVTSPCSSERQRRRGRLVEKFWRVGLVNSSRVPKAYYTVMVAASLNAGTGTVGLSPATGGVAGFPTNCSAPGPVVTLTPRGETMQDSIYGGPATPTMDRPVTVNLTFCLYPAARASL
jgi:hypothetical protein